MKKLLISIYFIILVSATFDPFSAYRKKIDESDMINYDNKITCEDALIWWDAADTLVLKIFNEVLEGQKPFEFFKKFVAEGIEGITVYAREDQSVGLDYSAYRPPDNETQNLSILIQPFENDGSIYYIGYTRLWNELPGCEGRLWHMGTYRIVKKNIQNGKYEIVARQEETNFYKKIIDSKQIKYFHGKDVPVCEWEPLLQHENIKKNVAAIEFEILYYVGIVGTNCQSRMYVSWKYDRIHALKATQYRYESCDYRYDPNVQLSDQFKNGEPATIPP